MAIFHRSPPITMRFKQADSYLGDVGDPASRNLYAYCGNDPVNYNDPTGHWGSKIHRKITKDVLDNDLMGYSLGYYDPISDEFSKVHKKLISRKFYNWIVRGCTYPDDYRFRDKNNDGVADKKSKLFDEKVFYDGNDKTTGYWHGGKGHELKGKNLTKEIKKAVEFFNKDTRKDYKRAGIYLGCIFHAVQDIEAHQYNEYIKNQEVVNYLLDEEISTPLYEAYDNNSKLRKYLKKRVIKRVYNRENEQCTVLMPKGKRFSKKKQKKLMHQIFADNPYAESKEIKNGKVVWSFADDYNESSRIIKSKKKTSDVLYKFVRRVH